MIPPGIHLISYRSSSFSPPPRQQQQQEQQPTDPHQYSPTTAFFVHLQSTQVACWRWRREDEILIAITDTDTNTNTQSEHTSTSITHAVRSFALDQHLAPYDLTSYPQWVQLSRFISQDTLQRVAPIGDGAIGILADDVDEMYTKNMTAAEKALEESLLSSSSLEAGSSGHRSGQHHHHHHKRCYYTSLPGCLVKRSGLSPEHLTALNLDKSPIVDEILSTATFNNRTDEFLGEFQFAFLAFLLGHSFSSLMQWKSFIYLLMGCEEGVFASAQRQQLFVGFLDCLHAQLSLCVAGIVHEGDGQGREEEEDTEGNEGSATTSATAAVPLVEDLLEDSFLRQLCVNWLRWVLKESRQRTSSGTERLEAAAEQLAALLYVHLGWDCGSARVQVGIVTDVKEHENEEEDDEDGPVIFVPGVDDNYF